MLKSSLLLIRALAFSVGVAAQAEPTDDPAKPTDDHDTPARRVPTAPTVTPVEPGSEAHELGGKTYWDIPGCHSYAWMKNHGTWLCAIHGEIQILFDPRHQCCGSNYGSFWHQCAYQI
jgi:hypothetical protein